MGQLTGLGIDGQRILPSNVKLKKEGESMAKEKLIKY